MHARSRVEQPSVSRELSRRRIFDRPHRGPAEPVVVMRRYRDRDRLASLVTLRPEGENDEFVRGVLDAIAKVLAGFHEHAERSPSIAATAT